MSTFVLIELCKQSGVKNVIYQLLAPSITLNLDEVEENRSYAVIIDKGIRYCLTGNSGIYDEEASYVLLTDRTPTKQKLIDNEIKQRKWIKHPNQIKASPDDVINSWENRFHLSKIIPFIITTIQVCFISIANIYTIFRKIIIIFIWI